MIEPRVFVTALRSPFNTAHSTVALVMGSTLMIHRLYTAAWAENSWLMRAEDSLKRSLVGWHSFLNRQYGPAFLQSE